MIPARFIRLKHRFTLAFPIVIAFGLFVVSPVMHLFLGKEVPVLVDFWCNLNRFHVVPLVYDRGSVSYPNGAQIDASLFESAGVSLMEECKSLSL